eukprot:m.77815 g.77815  ORF g.77815 m.77815 type:complete len:76 (-) comp14722_c0_seq2:25-252(-)
MSSSRDTTVLREALPLPLLQAVCSTLQQQCLAALKQPPAASAAAAGAADADRTFFHPVEDARVSSVEISLCTMSA